MNIINIYDALVDILGEPGNEYIEYLYNIVIVVLFIFALKLVFSVLVGTFLKSE